MDVGNGCIISDKWIPENLTTGLFDINGMEIKTSNRIKLNGCRVNEAIVGKTEDGFVLFFGTKNGSVMWNLNKELIESKKARLV